MDPVSGEVLAKWLGISGTQVNSFARRGVMVRAGRKGFDLEASVRAYATHLREAVAAQGRPAQSGTGKQRARLAAAQAEAIELKNKRLAGALLDAAAVEAEWAGIMRTVRASILRLPKRVAARLPHLSAQDVPIIDCVVRTLLAELVKN